MPTSANCPKNPCDVHADVGIRAPNLPVPQQPLARRPGTHIAGLRSNVFAVARGLLQGYARARNLKTETRSVNHFVIATMKFFVPAALGLVSLILAWPTVAAEPLVVEIWPGKVPEENGEIGAERIRMSPALDRKQFEVTEPTRMITDDMRILSAPISPFSSGTLPGQ